MLPTIIDVRSLIAKFFLAGGQTKSFDYLINGTTGNTIYVRPDRSDVLWIILSMHMFHTDNAAARNCIWYMNDGLRATNLYSESVADNVVVRFYANVHLPVPLYSTATSYISTICTALAGGKVLYSRGLYIEIEDLAALANRR